MEEKNNRLIIDIFKKKNIDEFSAALADKDGKLETGSAAALVASNACALLHRAAAICAENNSDSERVDYILRNSEILRTYMVHLIDEDVKCRAPLAKALREGDERHIEAARQPAVAICSELVNMMLQVLKLSQELLTYSSNEALHYIAECAALALSSAQCASIFITNMSSKSSDETYRYVLWRENDIAFEKCYALVCEIISSFEAHIIRPITATKPN